MGVNRKYSVEFKLFAIEFRRIHALSYLQAAARLKIPNEATLYVWEKKYLEFGAEALQDKRKGRPAKVLKQKPPEKGMTREEQLERENDQLRMENAYLKKLNTLVAEREKSEKKKK